MSLMQGVVLAFGPVLGVLAVWGCWLAAEYLARFAVTEPLPQISTQATTAPAILHWWQPHPPLWIPRVGFEIGSMLFFIYLALTDHAAWAMLGLILGFLFFLLVAVIDLKYRLVLNIMTFPALVLVLVGRLAGETDIVRMLLGGGLAFGVFFLTAWLRPGQLGGGDIKLALIIGLLFGFPQVLWALLVATGIGGLVAVYFLLQRRGLQMTMPYAPFLCFGATLALLYNPLSSF